MSELRILGCVLLMLLWGQKLYAKECPDPQLLGARYQITSNDAKGDRKESFNLWRKPNLVAHERPAQKVTDIWNHLRDGRTRPIRYFDGDQRAIEYQPGEVKNQSWEIQNQLLSSDWLQALTLVEEKGVGCWREQIYRLSANKQPTQTLIWLPELKLVKAFDQVVNSNIRHWELINVESDPATVAKEFAQRDSYLSTDFIDIGDNESDPFLRQMINLGFVEHAETGFYDAHGHSMSGKHQH